MIILDGEKLSSVLLEDIKKKISGRQLKLAVVLVGDNLASKSYISKKREVCEKIGVVFELFSFPSDVKEQYLKEEIKKISSRKDVSGVVIQLPLPKDFNTQEILNLVPLDKDIDVLSKDSFIKFSNGELNILPPVVGAIKYLLEEYKIDINGKKIVLIGKGRLVGKPLSVWFNNEKAIFDIIDRNTKDISIFTKEADIIISGAGSAGIIKEDMVKVGVVLIDAGTSCEEGIIKGDIDKDAYSKASFVAPVPGGIGPMTVACLLENLIKLK